MRALTVDPREAGSLRVETVADPEPGPNELLVSGMAIGVCGTDREIGEGPVGEGARSGSAPHPALGRRHRDFSEVDAELQRRLGQRA